MSFHELMGLMPPVSRTTKEAPKTTPASTIYTYATSFFKSLNERTESFVRSLAGRVTDFFKDLRARFEVDSNVVALKAYFQGLLNKPLAKNDPTDTLETRLASLGQFINDETLKANRALANLFYRTRAELLSRILGENKTEILATTVAASKGLAVADKGEKVNYQIVAGTQQAIETPQEIIANDIEQLKARTTAQKVWDFACSCTFGSNAKEAISLYSENKAKLKELLRPEHEKVMNSLIDLVKESKNMWPKDFRDEIEKIKPEIQEFMKEGNPFQKETKAAIDCLCSDLRKNAVFSQEAERLSIVLAIYTPSPFNSGVSTPTTLSDSDDSGIPSPTQSPLTAQWKIYKEDD